MNAKRNGFNKVYFAVTDTELSQLPIEDKIATIFRENPLTVLQGCLSMYIFFSFFIEHLNIIPAQHIKNFRKQEIISVIISVFIDLVRSIDTFMDSGHDVNHVRILVSKLASSNFSQLLACYFLFFISAYEKSSLYPYIIKDIIFLFKFVIIIIQLIIGNSVSMKAETTMQFDKIFNIENTIIFTDSINSEIKTHNITNNTEESKLSNKTNNNIINTNSNATVVNNFKKPQRIILNYIDMLSYCFEMKTFSNILLYDIKSIFYSTNSNIRGVQDFVFMGLKTLLIQNFIYFRTNYILLENASQFKNVIRYFTEKILSLRVFLNENNSSLLSNVFSLLKEIKLYLVNLKDLIKLFNVNTEKKKKVVKKKLLKKKGKRKKISMDKK